MLFRPLESLECFILSVLFAIFAGPPLESEILTPSGHVGDCYGKSRRLRLQYAMNIPLLGDPLVSDSVQ